MVCHTDDPPQKLDNVKGPAWKVGKRPCEVEEILAHLEMKCHFPKESTRGETKEVEDILITL